jgi:hypothetical protein
MGKSTISMAIFNSFLYVYQRVLGTSSLTELVLSTRDTFPNLSPGGCHFLAKSGTVWALLGPLRPSRGSPAFFQHSMEKSHARLEGLRHFAEFFIQNHNSLIICCIQHHYLIIQHHSQFLMIKQF